MSSPNKANKHDKENECAVSPAKKSISPSKKFSKVAFFALGNNQTLNQLQLQSQLTDKNFILEGLKPMDVNTSFD